MGKILAGENIFLQKGGKQHTPASYWSYFLLIERLWVELSWIKETQIGRDWEVTSNNLHLRRRDCSKVRFQWYKILRVFFPPEKGTVQFCLLYFNQGQWKEGRDHQWIPPSLMTATATWLNMTPVLCKSTGFHFGFPI